MLSIAPFRALQEQVPAFKWTYVWLAASGLVLALAILALAYLITKRHWAWFRRLMEHPLLHAIDRKLSTHFPRLWGFIRYRFSVRQWGGLALTSAVAVLFAAVYAFAVVTESWTDEEALYAFDHSIYRWLVEAMHPSLRASMRIVTRFGDTLTVLVISLVVGGYLLYKGYRWRLVELFMAVGVGSAFMWGLKFIFGRSRPEDQLAAATGNAFPSGHSFLAAALYGFLIYLVWRVVHNDAVRVVSTILLVLIIFLVGLSRVILRVHWVSDVVGGFAAGLAWLVCSLIITQGLRHYRSSDTV